MKQEQTRTRFLDKNGNLLDFERWSVKTIRGAKNRTKKMFDVFMGDWYKNDLLKKGCCYVSFGLVAQNPAPGESDYTEMERVLFSEFIA